MWPAQFHFVGVPGSSASLPRSAANGVPYFLFKVVGYVGHFADDVAGELARGDTLKEAINTAIARWMRWRINRRTSRETGIPKGLPYLTGFANHYAIMAELPY